MGRLASIIQEAIEEAKTSEYVPPSNTVFLVGHKYERGSYHYTVIKREGYNAFFQLDGTTTVRKRHILGIGVSDKGNDCCEYVRQLQSEVTGSFMYADELTGQTELKPLHHNRRKSQRRNSHSRRKPPQYSRQAKSTVSKCHYSLMTRLYRLR